MRKTAKSTISILLTLVMLLSSFAFFTVTGGAIEAKEVSVVSTNGIKTLSTDDDGIDIRLGVSSTATTAAGESYSGLSAQLFGLITKGDAMKGKTDSFGLSFSMTPETDAFADFYIRFRSNKSGEANLKLIDFTSTGNLKVLSTDVPGVQLQKNVKTDFHFDITVKWASASGTSNGTIEISLYVNGKFVDTYSTMHKNAVPHDFIQILSNKGSNTHINSENGASCAADAFGGNEPAGYYATFLIENLSAKKTAPVLPFKVVTGTGIVSAARAEDGSYDARLAVSSNAVISEYGGINETLAGLIRKVGAGKTEKFSFSFGITPETEALADFRLRIRKLGSGESHQNLINFVKDGSVLVLGKALSGVQLETGVRTDFCFDVEIQWASASGMADGVVTIAAYVDGVCVDTYTGSHNIATPDCIQMISGAGDNSHVNADNGATIGGNSYATFLLDDMSATLSSARDAFTYPGASMRLKDNAASSGLRFTYGVDKAWFDSLEGAKVGALIIPTDKLANGFSVEALAALTEGTDYIDIYADGFCETAEEADASTYVYYASLVNIREKNYTRSFTGIGFVELADGTRIYTGVQSRSIYEVAKNATISSNYEGTANEARIDEYLSKVVSLGDDFSVEAIENYERDIVGAASGDGFTLTGTGVDKIKTIIIGGVSYTGGWTVEGGVLTVASYVAD